MAMTMDLKYKIFCESSTRLTLE